MNWKPKTRGSVEVQRFSVSVYGICFYIGRIYSMTRVATVYSRVVAHVRSSAFLSSLRSEFPMFFPHLCLSNICVLLAVLANVSLGR